MRFRQYLFVAAVVAVSIAANSPTILDGTKSSHSAPTPEPQPVLHATESSVMAGLADQGRAVQHLLMVQTMHAELERQAHEQQVEAEREEARRVSSSASSPPATGTCAEMAPPGFDPDIITRESGGDPYAVNGDSGASGCAQLMPMHFADGGYCEGNDYATCWRRLKEGADRGDFPDPWACTAQSGCRG